MNGATQTGALSQPGNPELADRLRSLPWPTVVACCDRVDWHQMPDAVLFHLLDDMYHLSVWTRQRWTCVNWWNRGLECPHGETRPVGWSARMASLYADHVAHHEAA